MTTKIATTTSRGQITIPAQWRKKFKTNTFSLQMGYNSLQITPVFIEKKDEIIFDSERDTQGKSVDIDEFIKALKNI